VRSSNSRPLRLSGAQCGPSVRNLFTLVPIAPQRLEEKKSSKDFFFASVLREGVLLATEN
jgi:hypothetical protein